MSAQKGWLAALFICVCIINVMDVLLVNDPVKKDL